MDIRNAAKKAGGTKTVAHLLSCVSMTILLAVTAHAGDPTTCSTEKVNNDCVVNIDRRYPIAMPTFQMRPGKHITVMVYNPFHFETLTLDPQTAQALQGSDQGAALITAAIPDLKGLQASTKTTFFELDGGRVGLLYLKSVPPLQPETTLPAEKVVTDILNDLRDQKLASIQDAFSRLPDQIGVFDDEATIVYAQLKEIVSSVPRPVANDKDDRLAGTGVPRWSFDPWKNYANWRALLLYELNDVDGFTPPARKPSEAEVPEDILDEASQILLPELPSPAGGSGSSQPAKISGPNLFSDFETEAVNAKTDIAALKDPKLESKYQAILNDLVAKEQAIANALSPVSSSLAKVVADLQTYFANINYWTGEPAQTYISVVGGNDQPLPLGLIPDPKSPDPTLAPYKALGRQIVYTLNAENQIATSPLAVPTPAQKTAIATITVLYADPRFEVSAGAFVSSLPNRSFANYTDVKETVGSGSPVDIKIAKTDSRPELLPFAGANWRIGRDFIMPDKRRGAVYGTLAFALNPYNQLPEFGGGFSLSWRSFMFSPLYHLGHGIHLTQGEYPGELWCVYGVPSGSVPPPCTGNPPAPSTKTYWTGAFAFGISIRVPTTFASSGGSSH